MKDIAKGLMFLGIFAIPFIPLIISNSLFFPYITGKNFTFRIIVEVIFAAWIIVACFDPAYRPKRSFILGSFTAFTIILFFANLFGEYAPMAFWSNFERMEGFMAILHTWMLVVVLGSSLKEGVKNSSPVFISIIVAVYALVSLFRLFRTTGEETASNPMVNLLIMVGFALLGVLIYFLAKARDMWDALFITVAVSSTVLTMYAVKQLSGEIVINQGGWRLDGTLGNSAYMAVYMLFNIFIALLMLLRIQSAKLRYIYAALVALFVYLLIQTATRGTILGLVGGLGVTAAYIALFSKDHPKVRKIAAGGLVAVVLLVGTFIAFKESAFIQGNPYLSRVANITLSEGNVRFKIWDMAYEGFKERPILGWGQSGFSYVFNKEYDPSLYFAEAWYDRVHNIVFDWLIAGGLVGALAYFAIYFSAIYYLFLRPLLRQDTRFTVAERGILLGLLAGYLFHNLFVFDNIVSYIYYGIILAFIHSRVGIEWPQLAAWKPQTRIIEQVTVPVVGVALIAMVYFVNVPGIKAAGDIIDAFRASTPEDMMSSFNQALERNSFGDQEIREQMARRVQEIFFNQSVSQETKEPLVKRVEDELLKQIAEKPNDARAHVFLASFYRTIGTTETLDKAIAQLETARALSPRKQQIIFEQGLAYLQKQEYERAYEYFKEAYELDTTYTDARSYYVMGGIATGRYDLIEELITTDAEKASFYNNNLVIQVAYNAKLFALLRTIFEYRIAQNPTDPQIRTNLAYILHETGDSAAAIEVLKKAAEEIPTFKEQAEQFMTQIATENLEQQR